jgi:hypothetical protein
MCVALGVLSTEGQLLVGGGISWLGYGRAAGDEDSAEQCCVLDANSSSAPDMRIGLGRTLRNTARSPTILFPPRHLLEKDCSVVPSTSRLWEARRQSHKR